jgi:hypothetical protein
MGGGAETEQAGFSSLTSIGALSYSSFEELTVFAAAVRWPNEFDSSPTS